uniref:C1q and TNF related 13 n=1 Tax=Gasterosteus aculeatus aculeatus TaxID=481459 RepID=A0AAQ4QIS7_GASAC
MLCYEQTRSVTSALMLKLISPLHAPPATPDLRSAFSATRTNSVISGKQKEMTFDRLMVNIGGDFNPDTGHFRCPFPKILVKNGEEVQAMAYDDYRKKGRKLQSQSVMISLKEMDTVWLLLQQNPQYALYSNAVPYITFSGYLVLPDSDPSARGQTSEQPQSAFSVARTSTLMGQNIRQQDKSPLTFDVEFVNIGGHFNQTSGLFTCHFPGAYFFAFTVGKHARRAVSVKLMTGKGEVQAMVFDEQDEHYAVYSNQGRYTTFSGFLFYHEAEPASTQDGAAL